MKDREVKSNIDFSEDLWKAIADDLTKINSKPFPFHLIYISALLAAGIMILIGLLPRSYDISPDISLLETRDSLNTIRPYGGKLPATSSIKEVHEMGEAYHSTESILSPDTAISSLVSMTTSALEDASKKDSRPPSHNTSAFLSDESYELPSEVQPTDEKHSSNSRSRFPNDYSDSDVDEYTSSTYKHLTVTRRSLATASDDLQSSSKVVVPIAVGQHTTSIQNLPSINFYLTNAVARSLSPPLIDHEPVFNHSSSRSRLSLMPWVGVNSIHLDYSSLASSEENYSEIKDDTEKGIAGMSSGLLLSYALNPSICLESGLEYHQYWTNLKVNLEQKEQVPFVNQLLKVWIDQNSGDTLRREYGDTTGYIITTRSVNNFNQFERISIPFQVAVQKNHKKWLYGLSAGISLNFNIRQGGKTLDSSLDLTTIGNKEDDRILTPLHLSWRLSPILGYHAKEGLLISLRPMVAWDFMHQSASLGGTLRARTSHIQLGCSYTFRQAK